jgi:hypothetical protein
MAKNPEAKTRPVTDPYEYWMSSNGSWVTAVLKKYQVDDNKPYARWFVKSYTFIMPEGEMGDTYVSEVKGNLFKVKHDTARDAIARLQGRNGAANARL